MFIEVQNLETFQNLNFRNKNYRWFRPVFLYNNYQNINISEQTWDSMISSKITNHRIYLFFMNNIIDNSLIRILAMNIMFLSWFKPHFIFVLISSHYFRIRCSSINFPEFRPKNIRIDWIQNQISYQVIRFQDFQRIIYTVDIRNLNSFMVPFIYQSMYPIITERVRFIFQLWFSQKTMLFYFITSTFI